MATICVLSDIHGNYPALSAVTNSEPFQSAEMRICLGDILGITGYPSQVITEIQETCDIVLKGNHDILPFDGDGIDEIDAVEKQVFFDETTASQQSYIYNLPVKKTVTNEMYEGNSWTIEMGHAHIEPTLASGAESGNAGIIPRDFIEIGSKYEETVILTGHTHVQHSVDIRNYGHTVVMCNPGSVGDVYQETAEFATIDTETYEVTLHSVSYDVEKKYARLTELEDTYNVQFDIADY